jgi:MoaA/NifB/PqqE/SkfB family radical SAM enzyme
MRSKARSLAERYLKKVPQYTRNHRHAQTVIRHGNPRKWMNLVRVETERKLRRVKVTGYPYILFIDPCNYCNLRCPLCPTGIDDLGRPQSMMSLDHFKKYFDPFAPYLFEAYMHNWGESLLNKNVYRMIEHVQSRNVGTNLSSNFVKLNSDDLDAIIDCGLEYLVVSLDGTDQETYVQYRVRGDYDRVIANVAELLRRRNSRASKTPFIEWQFIVMRQNESQIPKAQEIAKKLGVDLLRFIPVGMPADTIDRQAVAEKWFPRSVKGRVKSDGTEIQFSQADKPGPCFYLYRSFVINPDGGVSPCCIVPRQHTDFANLAAMDDIDVLDVYNNASYQAGRAQFLRKPSRRQHTGTVCDTCDIFARPAGNPMKPQPEMSASPDAGGFVSSDSVTVGGSSQSV